MINLYKTEQLVKSQMKNYNIPGFCLGIIKKGEIFYANGFGITSIEENKTNVTPQTLFRITSISKNLTAVAIMKLVELGKLNLDIPISNYVEDLKFYIEGVENKITLRTLLSHKTGLYDGCDFFGYRGLDGLELYIKNDLPKVKFIAPPETLFSYSRHNLNIAGYIAQKVYGKSFPQIMKELIFVPLNMNCTTYDPTIAITYSLAQSHYIDEDGKLRVVHRFPENTAYYPSSFAISTLNDLLNFASMLINEGIYQNNRILSPESIKEMFNDNAYLYMVNGDGYGLTFGIDKHKGVERYWITGGMGSYYSSMIISPDKGFGVVTLSNGFSGFWWLINRLYNDFLELPNSIFIPPKKQPNKSLWKNFEGNYLGDAVGLGIIKVEGEELTLKLNDKTFYLISAEDYLYYNFKYNSEIEVSIGFIKNGGKPIEYIMINGCPCRRIEPIIFEVNSETIEKYAGTYEYENFEKLILYNRNEKLFLRKENDETICYQIDENLFFAEGWGIIEFKLDGKGNTVSLLIQKTYEHKKLSN